jgi:orotate phosphoribosyltransferase
MPDSRLAELKRRLQPLVATCVKRSATPTFKLKSGKLSDFYFDGRLVTLQADSLRLIGEVILELLSGDTIAAVGGPSIGADPIVGAVLALAGGVGLAGRDPSPIQNPQSKIQNRAGRDPPLLTGFMIRKEAKDHGLGKRIEGPVPPAGSSVVLLEDVVTTGGSTLEALAAVRAEWPAVRCARAICLVDRLEGGRESLAREGVALTPIFTREEFPVRLP